MLFCSINQQVSNAILVADRALNYGDGVFTTARITAGQIEFCSAHFNRLISACYALDINNFDHQNYLSYCQNIASKYNHAVMKIVITAGIGGRGYSRVGIEYPQVIVTIFDLPKHYADWQQQGVSLGVAEYQLGLNPKLAGIKHLNRLEQVLIRRELDQSLVDDLVVTDLNGAMVEASCANIFWLKQGQLYTPKLINAGVNGIMRQHILANLPQSQEVLCTIDTLNQCDAIYLTNSLMGIVPVKQFQQRLLQPQYFGWLADALV